MTAVAKHVAAPAGPTSTPPSKNSRASRAPPFLSGCAHGGLIATRLAVEQPLVKALTSRMSPSWWAPVKLVAPPGEVQSTVPSLRNQVAMLELPSGEDFSTP